MVPLTLFFPILFEFVELCTMYCNPNVLRLFFFCLFLTSLTLKSFLGTLQNHFFLGFLLETLLLLLQIFLSGPQNLSFFFFNNDFDWFSSFGHGDIIWVLNCFSSSDWFWFSFEVSFKLLSFLLSVLFLKYLFSLISALFNALQTQPSSCLIGWLN